ncbi:hypothetical protein [Nitrososphaera sp.]|uniref:hypothetical protein n=1 Tax=Nitrososphaera sp. TaxID=1971748 RepID=UPI00307EF113
MPALKLAAVFEPTEEGGERSLAGSTINYCRLAMRCHEYLSPLKERYAECRLCGKRTPHACVKCGYCYSCHPAVERVASA